MIPPGSDKVANKKQYTQQCCSRGHTSEIETSLYYNAKALDQRFSLYGLNNRDAAKTCATVVWYLSQKEGGNKPSYRISPDCNKYMVTSTFDQSVSNICMPMQCRGMVPGGVAAILCGEKTLFPGTMLSSNVNCSNSSVATRVVNFAW